MVNSVQSLQHVFLYILTAFIETFLILQLFDRLGGQGSEYVSQHEYEKKVRKALQPYEDNSQDDSDEDVLPGNSKPSPQDAYVEDEDEESGSENEQVLQQNTRENDDISSPDEL